MSAPGYEWFNSLKHGGMLIAPARLPGHFPGTIDSLPERSLYALRKVLTRDHGGKDAHVNVVLTTVLQDVCGLRDGWIRGPALGTEFTARALSGETLRPRWVWKSDANIPIFVDTDVPRLGVGRGRRSCSRAVEWLRAKDAKIALVTNLLQWRLVYAGIDFDAWVEWDSDLWLEEGREAPQLTALRILLSPDSLTSRDTPSPLLTAIQESRKGQAELSSELGERVRTAVETLIQSHAAALTALDGSVDNRHIYLAATRTVMRMVVALFAEARDLLPRDNTVYHLSYGLGGLRESLERSGAGKGIERLRHRSGAWPRIISLFRLIYHGAYHPSLPVPRYGGNLFEPGSAESTDPLMRAIAVFEDAANAPSDAVVFGILNLLCRSRVRVRQGTSSTWVEAPVDFSDLSSEYIGILYEGLLDYELKRVDAQDPVIFLGLGDQPALNLAALEGMDDKAIAGLVEKMKVSKKQAGDGEDADEDDDAVTADETPGVEEPPPEPAEVPVITDDDRRQQARERALGWARKAVISAKIVKNPRGKQGASDAVDAAAATLIRRVVLPGEWFLVRWGGTRKGSGTFYTRPQLAVPTVHRTLRPLAFIAPLGPDGTPDELAPAHAWTPRKPEEILALKICDPGMGSASFPVAVLRFLTDALYQSLHYHKRISIDGERTLVAMIDGTAEGVSLTREFLPCLPDSDEFEQRLKARLKRHVVERCIYGVDLDPLAVELGRLALWIETMDRDLPFEFLDHKLKCGNSLVGCRLDRFRDYPALAWKREGGDGAKGSRTKAIADALKNRVIPELCDVITGQMSTFEPANMPDPTGVHREALDAIAAMARIPVHDAEQRAAYYKEHILRNEHILGLKQALDTWCAIWFWPVDGISDAPMPKSLLALTDAQKEVVKELVAKYRFFHWELEFPEVFTGEKPGFCGMVGNPPWETMQPVDKEFFSNFDPLYRTYGQQEAKAKQEERFASSSTLRTEYVEYVAYFKSFANWVKCACSPWGDPETGDAKLSLARGKDNVVLHNRWRERRARHAKGSCSTQHCFRHQGEGKPYTYKLFLELCHELVRDGAPIGMIVPSGVYSDKGSGELRKLFLDRCEWKWIFSFENRDKIFDIHRSFKFGPIIVRKGGTTKEILTAFMRHDVNDWEHGQDFVTPYPYAQVRKFSPFSLSILEIRGGKDIEILDTIYSNSVLLGDDGPDGWGIKYAQGDFNMTSDSKLFPPRPKWEEKGYKPDEYGRWIGPDEDVALPLYEGRMVGQFDFSQKGWVSGKGRGAKWREIPWEKKVVEPQFVMASDTFQDAKTPWKAGQMRVSSATNTRTVISTFLSRVPCGDKVATLRARTFAFTQLLPAYLNSFVLDYVARKRVAGLQVDQHILVCLPLPPSAHADPNAALFRAAASLQMPSWIFAPEWLVASHVCAQMRTVGIVTLWAVAAQERMRLQCILDALVAQYYGLDLVGFSYCLDECALPLGDTESKALDPKGFWRVDKDKPPELRHTVLSLVAFHDLQAMIASHNNDRDKGITAFCTQNNGEGWMLPSQLRLSDYGLGHDDRAREYQPVAEKFGPRFYDWQLAQSPEESWAECERHARNILGEEGFARLLAEIERAKTGEKTPVVNEPVASYDKKSGLVDGEQMRLL